MISLPGLPSILSRQPHCKDCCQYISLAIPLSEILSQLLPSILMTFPMLVFLMKNFIAARSDGWKLLQRNVHRHLLKLYSPDNLPNVYTLMKCFARLPLSSCSCERSASALRRLNNYLRSTQTAEQLTALALIQISYEVDIDTDTICKLYLEKYPRIIQCASLLFQ